jgi:hypothetical protein
MKLKSNAGRTFPVVFKLAICTVSCVMAFVTKPALAVEGGAPGYPANADNYGCCALLLPDLYVRAPGERHNETSPRDNDGFVVAFPVLQVNAYAIVRLLIGAANAKIFGDSLAPHSVAPLATLDVQVAEHSRRHDYFQCFGVL